MQNTRYDDFMKKYDEEHKYCPNCGTEDCYQTLVGYILDLDHPEDYKDKNECGCNGCGHRHIVHDRVATPPNTIKFIWNSSFVGTNHKMIINGKTVRLGGVVSTAKESTIEAILILKEKYNINMHVNDVNWEWGYEM
jgi:hypothetical protein